MLLNFVALAAALSSPPSRTRTLLADNWRFQLDDRSVPTQCHNASIFPTPRDDQQCMGLDLQAQVDSLEGCRDLCCGNPECEVWQWCANGAACGLNDECFTGRADNCAHDKKGWKGQSRTLPPPPPPPPPKMPCAKAECQPAFDDSSWRVISLPHDFVIEATPEFSPLADKAHGYLPYNKGWYRYHLTLPASTKGLPSWLEFEGVQRDMVAYLNGKWLCAHPSGYTSFRCALDGEDVVKSLVYAEDGTNVLAVRVDATHPEGWWYDGGGLYRHVYLSTAPTPLHLKHWGVYLPSKLTSAPDARGRTADAMLLPHTTVVNRGSAVVMFAVRSMILDANGKEVASVTSANKTLAPNADIDVASSVALSAAHLWSPDAPYLYRCETTVLMWSAASPVVIDSAINTFGVRSLAWDADSGLSVNGVPTKVRGFANHQDYAGVGVAVPDSLQGYRVATLQSIGANAWRTAHNPPNGALLDACDELGMLVWDENHRNSVAPSFLDDLESLVLRDRNHPSVIMWSLCNEVLCEQFNASRAMELRGIIKRLDPLGDRVVTAAMNGGFDGQFPEALDVFGVNYHIDEYDKVHAARPKQPIIGSETGSDVSDRGIYANDPKVHKYVSSYDVNKPPWAQTEEDAWCAIAQRPYVAGGFCWTGFDYKGEPTPYGWPNVNSHFGVFDMAGFPKDNALYYKSAFSRVEEEAVLHLLPHWNWDDSKPGANVESEVPNPWGATTASNTNTRDVGGGALVECKGACRRLEPSRGALESRNGGGGGDLDLATFLNAFENHHRMPFTTGTGAAAASHLAANDAAMAGQAAPRAVVDVWAYGNGHTIELRLNGVSLGNRTLTPQPRPCRHVEWKGVPFSPGTLEAIMSDARGRLLATQRVQTTGAAEAITLDIEWPRSKMLSSNATDSVAVVTAALVDSSGARVPTAHAPLTFTLTGPGAIIGVGNGDPSSHERDKPSAPDLARRSAWNGLARVLVQAKRGAGVGQGSSIRLHAEGKGVKGAADLVIRVD